MGRLLEPSSRQAWATEGDSISIKKKICQAWWHLPVVPATQEAEARGSVEPGRSRLQRAMIAPLHSSLGNRVRICLKKLKKKKSAFLVGSIELGHAFSFSLKPLSYNWVFT